MNFQQPIKLVTSHENIWDDYQICAEAVEDCSPQKPYFTRQFLNTLKENKGKPLKEFREVASESLCEPEESGDGSSQKEDDFESKVELKGSLLKQSMKPMTFDFNSSPNHTSQVFNKKEGRELRKISSSEILRVLTR
ncbi:unnamed protein product [Moneuplotes crassus]|uniref:Uncharacterized protein n=1 Tax=Euplotes crassus TaxID=5936 RepID=A0AAD2DAU0_EUPCR|nr:unnamed protein product [Moneuplotes crassus]